MRDHGEMAIASIEYALQLQRAQIDAATLDGPPKPAASTTPTAEKLVADAGVIRAYLVAPYPPEGQAIQQPFREEPKK